MNVQTSYPIFEHGQVLTSAQLNDLVEYLEQQDRLSRRALSGIGIACGFEVDARGDRLTISKGVAVTSEGFLIAAEAQTYDRFRPYEVPVPTAEEADKDEIAEARYPFLFPGDGAQIAVFELVDTDFAPALGEDEPEALSPAALAGKTVMLFLECRLESLKNCDINDCSDKGSERRFTLRRLLVTHDQADAMLAQEAGIAGRPVDRANHPRLSLPYLRIEKLALARTGTGSFMELFGRILSIALKFATALAQALRDAYAAYEYLLADLYDEGEEPFPDTHFSNVWGQLALNLFMVQYFYDYLRDVAMACNEFVEAASRFEAECLPDPGRFPKHVLLGDATGRPDAFATEFASDGAVVAFDQSGASAGVGLTPRPAARRSHFVPAPAVQDRPRLEEVRALFVRMHLLALTYRTQDRMAAPIRLTPSRGGAAPLSERAIPFHYAFDTDSDLFRNWSPRKTRANLLGTVYSYRFSAPDAAHPLHFRLDDQDFVRVEGIVGKPLGSAMAELVAWKRALGLSFAIEPVFMPLAAGRDDRAGRMRDTKSAAVAAAAARKLILCRMSELDAFFLTFARSLFALLVHLVQQLGRQPVEPSRTVAQPAPGGGLTTAVPTGKLFEAVTAARLRLDLAPDVEERLKLDAGLLREELAQDGFATGAIVGRLNPDAGEETTAAVFTAVKDEAVGGNLFDRTRAFVLEKGGDETAVQATYAPVALIAQAEQMMATLGVESVVDFDEQRFATAYRGFSDAYANYAAVTEAIPARDTEAANAVVGIAASAGLVASQAATFAAANVQSEFAALLTRLFEDLMLPGYVRRHPGLEHHAGVPLGGTLVLAYVSLDDLAEQAGPILGASSRPLEGIAKTLGQGRVEPSLKAAFQALEAAASDASSDPLDRFVVLADFCLPYQCCDTDCSDVELSKRIVADPFGDVDPGPMAVPPLDPGRPPSTPRPSTPRPGIAGDFKALPRTPVVVLDKAGSRGLRTAIEDFVAPAGVAAILRRAGAEHTAPDADRPDGAKEAVLTGIVGTPTRGGQVGTVDKASVVITAEDGTTRKLRVDDDGSFSVTVPPGEVRIRGAATGFTGASTAVALTPGERREMTLIVRKRR